MSIIVISRRGVHTLERRFWGVVVGVNLPYSAFLLYIHFFNGEQTKGEYYFRPCMDSLQDAILGNNNTKIVKLLDLLKKQLDRIEKKIEELK